MQNAALQQHVQTIARRGRTQAQPQCLRREELKRALQKAFDGRRRERLVRLGQPVEQVGVMNRRTGARRGNRRVADAGRTRSSHGGASSSEKKRPQRLFAFFVESRVAEDGCLGGARGRELEQESLLALPSADVGSPARLRTASLNSESSR